MPLIKASSGYELIRMFFKDWKYLIWVTTHKVSSEFPQGYAVILCFFLISWIVEGSDMQHLWQISQDQLQ